MEYWHLSEREVLKIPSSRRVRLILKKADLEKERNRHQEQEASRVRSSSRRRR